jgi:hypothetical protein
MPFSLLRQRARFFPVGKRIYARNGRGIKKAVWGFDGRFGIAGGGERKEISTG